MSGGAKFGLAVLGIVFLLPGACGGLFFGAALVEWLSKGFSFGGGPDNYTGAFVVIAAPSILLSVVLLGILMRNLRWDGAPKASLVLAIVAAVVTVLGLAMLAEEGGNTQDALALYAAALVCFVISAVPPFLHWKSGRIPPAKNPQP